MNFRRARVLVLATLCVFAFSVAGWADSPCGVANEIYCQQQDGTGVLFASQNDTNVGGFGAFATTYDNFTLSQTWDVESFHWVGGYFNGGQSAITAWTLTFYNDAAGIPGNAIAAGTFSGNGNETLLSNGLYQYDLFFQSFDMGPGTYWASVVPDLGFPPQWGWTTSAQGDLKGYQCFFGTCGVTTTDFAFALDGTAVNAPEPGTMALLGTGLLGLVAAIRRRKVS